MRPIAALAAGPWCFPDTIAASPGQGPLRCRLAGHDLTRAGRLARRHRTAAARTGGGAGGHAGGAGGAGAVAGGGCQRGGSRWWG
jgi:hypothetical protein